MHSMTLAWRNLLRNRRRTLTTLLTMVFGIVGILLFGGFNRAMQYGLETAFVRSLGHLQVQHRDYLQYGGGNPAEYGIRDYQRVLRTFETDPVLSTMLVAATPILTMGGIAGRYETSASRTALAQGSEPEGQNRLGQWDAYHLGVPPRRAALTGTPPDAAVLGRGLAKSLGLCVNGQGDCSPAAPHASLAPSVPSALPTDIAALVDATPADPPSGTRIELLTATAAGAPNVARLQVVGLETQGARELDDIYVGLHLAQAQRLLYGNGEPMVTAIVLQLRDSALTSAAQARLQQLFQTELSAQPLAAHDFVTLQPIYERIVHMFGVIFGFVFVLIASVALFTVSNAMNMAVVERTVEIGTLRSMGLRRREIQKLFLCEGALLGVLGCVCGLTVALVLSWVINQAGLTWLPPGVAEPSPIVIRIWGEFHLVTTTVAGLVGVALLSSWLPARRAARANIVAALRHA